MTLTCWEIRDGFPGSSGVKIYPHIMFCKLFTYEELITVVNDIKRNLFQNIKIYEKNTYTNETNGTWNIVFSIQHSGYEYPYMIRNDSNCKKSYGCPVVKPEYFSVGERDIRKLNGIPDTDNSKNPGTHYFDLEEYIMALYKSRKIDSFPSSLDEIESMI